MKKVLASVLAGTMVLGMASMASAASTLGLDKAESGKYDYQLYLYQPLIYTEDSDTTYQMAPATEKALDRFTTAYNSFRDNRTPEALRTHLNNTAAFNIFQAYVDLANSAKNDVTNQSPNSHDAFDDMGLVATTASPVTSANVALTVWANPSTYPVAPGSLSDTDCLAMISFFTNNNITPSAIKSKLAAVGSGTNSAKRGAGEYLAENKAHVDIADKDYMSARGLDQHFMYTYGEDNVKEVKFEVIVKHGDDFRVDVASGKVTVTRKRVDADTANDTDTYVVSIKAAAGVRDFELDDFKVELDCSDANRVYYIEGQVAYSDYREVLPDDRYIIKKSNKDNLHNDGCIFNFDEVIDEETRIICNDYVDVLLKGNYGTDFENMKVETDDISEVEDFFQDYDIDYYDFIGTPKFAKDITVRIDADSDAYIYEYDKKTGDVVDITDECEYTSDGMTFKRKSLKTYVVLEEPYEGGNVKAEKEPVSEEPEDEPDDTEEPADDTNNAGSKPNPGTGAYPQF